MPLTGMPITDKNMANRPVLVVEPGLMSNLMSMR